MSRKKPRWHNLFDGPVERVAPLDSFLGEDAQKIARADLVRRAMRIKSECFGIEGGAGKDWMEFAIALLGDRDDNLKIVDPPKSDAIWLGAQGLALIHHVEMTNEELGGNAMEKVIFGCILNDVPNTHVYAKMSEAALKTAYHKACKHFNKLTIFKQRKKSTG